MNPQVLVEQGEQLMRQGRYREAQGAFQQAADGFAACGEILEQLRCRFYVGQLLSHQGKYGEAERELRKAAAAAEALDDLLTRCNAFRNLGEVLATQGKYGNAEQELRKAAAAADKLVDPLTRCNAFTVLGNVLRVRRKFSEAECELRKAAAAANKLDDPLTRCNAFQSVGEVLRVQGKYGEAERALRKAAAAANKLDDPLTLANIASSRAILAFLRRDWSSGFGLLSRFLDHVFDRMSRNRWPKAVGNLMASYGWVFDMGLRASEECASERWRAGRGTADSWLGQFRAMIGRWLGRAKTFPDALWLGPEFVDGAKCVAVREGLRRQGRCTLKDGASPAWQAAPGDWRDIFLSLTSPLAGPISGVLSGAAAVTPSTPTLEGARRGAVRGLRGVGAAATPPTAELPLLELPGESDPIKGQFCRPITKDGVARLLPDSETVLVTFYWWGDDLVVLPIRRDDAGELVLLHTPEGYFRAPGILPVVRTLAEQHEEVIVTIVEDGHAGSPAPDLNRALGPITELYERLYRLLRFGALLDLVEPDAVRRSQLHLVLVPDGPLYGLPLHAVARSAAGPRLYQEVASARYGLSLRTLELQQDVQDARAADERNDRALRGVAFANPDRTEKIIDGVTVREPEAEFLEGVIREVQAVVEEAGPGAWWLHGDNPPEGQQAVRDNFRDRHRAGNLGWFMTHGGEFEDEVKDAQGRIHQVRQAAMLLCDGPVGLGRLFSDGYDCSGWRLVHFSCCLLGRLQTLGASHEVLGYIAALTLLGCRRMSSALWWLSDESASVFARFWIRAIKNRVFGPTPAGPHAFALAFKEALDALRAFDNGRFDHEFYWAPCTLYGLG